MTFDNYSSRLRSYGAEGSIYMILSTCVAADNDPHISRGERIQLNELGCSICRQLWLEEDAH